MKTIAILNRKGGVGKTSSAIALSREYDQQGMLTLLIDLDAQVDLTRFLLPEIPQDGGDILAVLKGKKLPSEVTVEVPGTNNMYIIPGSRHLESFNFQHSQKALRDCLLDPCLSEVDLVLIDCPSTLNPAVMCGLHAADFALIVTEAELPSIENIRPCLEAIDEVSHADYSHLQPLGILINRVDLRRNVTRHNLSLLSATYGSLVLESSISVDSAIVSSYNKRMFVRDYSYRARCVSQFSSAASEILRRIGLDESANVR